MNHYDPDAALATEWDELLKDGLIRPPSDFQARVLHRLQQEPDDTKSLPSFTGSLTAWLQSAAVLVAAIAAGWQTFAFVFGLWVTAVVV